MMPLATSGTMQKARKFIRFLTIYGVGRSVYKAAGRSRANVPLLVLRRHRPDIGIVGCGQFSFAHIGYFLQRALGRRIATCFDIDPSAQRSFGRAMHVEHVAPSFDELLARQGLRTLYIASNHASHADYAVAALKRDLTVYIEKPVAVTRSQLVALLRAMRESRGRVFAGYNRPFSAAIRTLRKEIVIDPGGGISLQCFVSGHMIGPDHWYRKPEEGTRVCGNIGHWLDLMVHVFAWRGMPDVLELSLTAAERNEPDDNVVISGKSDRGDVFSLFLTSRCEPFEGINETINVQHADTICKIDDFRTMTIWQRERLIRKRFWPKDVGHQRAILQPFQTEIQRDWHEVVLSTLLMLHVTEMARTTTLQSTFSFQEAWAKIRTEIEMA
jgi:predicted dehydrogenase